MPNPYRAYVLMRLFGRFSSPDEGRFPGHRIGSPLRHFADAVVASDLSGFELRRALPAKLAIVH